LVVHGHPDERFRYTEQDDFSPDILGGADVLVLGHTHHQALAEFNEGTIVNPGSVGDPRDGDERAAYAVLDLVTQSVELRRVSFNIDRVLTEIEKSSISAYHMSRFRRRK
jgi:predicted phosphodiesterase